MSTDLEAVLGHLPLPLALTTGPEHVLQMITSDARDVLGITQQVGESVRAPGDPQLVEALDRAYRGGEPARSVPVPGGAGVTCLPLRDAGRVVGLLLHAVDPAAGDADGGRSRSAALQQLAEQLSGAATPSAIGTLAVTAAARVIAADAASVYVPSGPGELRVLHATGWSAATSRRFERLTLQRGRPLSDAVLDGTAVWLEDAAQWRARYPEMAPVGTSEGFEASACLPLRVEDRDLGAIVFTFATPRVFSGRERSHLLAVAALCAQALDRSRLLVAEREARTQAERQLARMTFLARTAGLMEAPHSVEDRLQQLADLAVTGIADWCAVHLVRDGHVARVAVAHADPEKLDFVARLEERYPPDPDAANGAIAVSRTGRAVFLPDIPDDLVAAAARDPEHLQLLRSLGMRSAIVVPLSVRDERLGALTLVNAESGEHFTDTDLAFARQLAATAAVALDNARLYQQQWNTAHTLQSALLPVALPATPGLDVAARYRPQRPDRSDVLVGGDVYDVAAGPGARHWAVTVADVCGKGAEAAALTAMLRHTIRAEVGHGLGPVEVLRRVNGAMLRDPGAEPARFATVAHAHLEAGDDGVLVRLVNAGHVPALVLRPGTVEVVGDPGTLLGVYDEVLLTETVVHLDRGDLLFLYTDGITEARGMNGWYGSERLAALLATLSGRDCDTVADAVMADVLAFQDDAPRDDIALLVVGCPR